MVHGGLESSSAPQNMEILKRAALEGHDRLMLSSGDTGAMEGAVTATMVLEDSPLFNAGYGSVLNSAGEVEMDAGIVDGFTGRMGAVAVISGVANPIAVAHRVLTDTEHVLLAGAGAVRFAREKSFPEANLVSPSQRASWMHAMEKLALGEKGSVNIYTGVLSDSQEAGFAPVLSGDTVGCVVVAGGRTCAASSTGGCFFTLPGRVGDSPVLGGGIYASIRSAVVCTGLGEAFIETQCARFVDQCIEKGLSPREAAAEALKMIAVKRKQVGGLLVVASDGSYGAATSAGGFPAVLVVNGVVVEEFYPESLYLGL